MNENLIHEAADVVNEQALDERKQLLKAKQTRAKIFKRMTWVQLGNIIRDFDQEKPTANFTHIDGATINNECGIVHDKPKVLTSDETPSSCES